MRIGCLQFAPQVGDVSNNITRADAVLSKADPADLENLDLLVLPEMALSGYNFKSREAIEPFLEPTAAGVSSQWARTTARKYDCTVAVGYPERDDASEYYNSLAVVDGQGETLANYRKSFLYYTDENWAKEGQGFYGGKLGSFGQVAMGICMDVNPYKFEAPWTAYEFAFHVLQVQANLVILSTAWLTNDERSDFLASAQDPDLSTLTYWARRLEPIIRADSPDETIVVFCNRCGIEDDATYAGTSTVMGIKDGEVSIYGLLGRGVEELLVVDTAKQPFGKLIDRPGPPTAEDGKPTEPPLGSEPGYPKGSNGGPGSQTDSPTLPQGPTPSSRTHTAAKQHACPSPTTNTNTNTNTNTETKLLPQPSPKKTSHTRRPKLSINTDIPTLNPSQTTFTPTELSSPSFSSNLPSTPASPTSHTPFEIPIFVEAHTPDDHDWPEYDDLVVETEFLIPHSPWSCASQSPLHSSGLLGAHGHGEGKHTIRIAASPSIFGGSSAAVW